MVPLEECFWNITSVTRGIRDLRVEKYGPKYSTPDLLGGF